LPFINSRGFLPLAPKFRIASVDDQSSEFQTDQLDYPAFVEGEVVDIKALLDHH